VKINFTQRNKPRIEMLPLIDIVFLLLVFFIYAMLSNKQMVELTDLQTILQSKPLAEKEKGVQIFADRMVEYQRLFTVLDSIKKAGISQISLQAERDGGS